MLLEGDSRALAGFEVKGAPELLIAHRAQRQRERHVLTTGRCTEFAATGGDHDELSAVGFVDGRGREAGGWELGFPEDLATGRMREASRPASPQ